MKMMINFFAVALLAAGTLESAAIAQEPGSRQRRGFVQMAGESDRFEVMEARTALAESRDPHVLAFARQMIRDHGETSRMLRQAAARAGLKPPPMQVGAGQASFLAALQSLSGREFDREYWRQQALAHRAALTVEQQYAASGDTPAIRQVAAAAVPVIQSHLAMAEQMSANGKAPALPENGHPFTCVSLPKPHRLATGGWIGLSPATGIWVGPRRNAAVEPSPLLDLVAGQDVVLPNRF